MELVKFNDDLKHHVYKLKHNNDLQHKGFKSLDKSAVATK